MGEKMNGNRQIEEKKSWKPGNVLSPVPVVLVTCGGSAQWKANIITIAWTGTVCSDPAMVSISVRPDRYSYEILESQPEFVINLPTLEQARITDWCGMVSGRSIDKFSETGLTQAPALQVECPIIAGCPVNIECRIKQTLPLGSHVMYLAEVVAVQVSSYLLDPQGRFQLEKAGLLAYGLGQYFALGAPIDRYGFSVRKDTPRRRKPAKRK